MEYQTTWLNLADGASGSTFFLATGFHGLHVLIGTAFLTVSLCRLAACQLSAGHHVGFEASAWYFHSVDVIWLYLFTCIYW